MKTILDLITEGKITECWLVNEESIYFLILLYEEGKIGPQVA